MKLVLLTLLLLIPYIIKADDSRFIRVFTSSNGKFELRNDEDSVFNQKWKLIEKESGSKLYEIYAGFASQSVLISNDGQNLVAVDDYSESDPQDNPEVLQFYLKGRKLKSYKLSDLLENTKFVSKSVSHFHWIMKPFPLAIDDTKFKLTTYELFNYEFDINTGKKLKKERDSRLVDGAIYAFGDISGSMSGEHNIKIRCLIYGQMPPDRTAKFESKDYIYDGQSFYGAVLIKDGKLIDHFDLILNMCK